MGEPVALFSSVELGHRALDYHLERQNVLAGNVANVETPGFQPLELTRPEERAETGPGPMPLRTTDAAHLPVITGVTPGGFEIGEERVVNGGNDDNAVSLERELAKVAANHLRYEGATTIVQAQLSQLRYAANDAQGG